MNSKEPQATGGKVPCPYCQRKFQALHLHKPYCMSKPVDEEDFENSEKTSSLYDTDDEDDGREPCPYCHERFKRLDKHKPHCQSKAGAKDIMTKREEPYFTADTDDEDDGREPCPYCHERFKRLDKHEPHCQSKADAKDILTKREEPYFTADIGDEDDGREPCPYCHERFKRLDKHKPHCQSKAGAKDILTKREEPYFTDDTDDEDDGREPCPYCHERFKRLDKHKPHCQSKAGAKDVWRKHEELSSSDEDDEESYLCCNERYTELAKHKPYYPAEDDGNLRCPYCQKKFKRLDLHKDYCSSNPEFTEESCPYCDISFKNLAIHLSKCERRPPNYGDESFEKFKKVLTLNRKETDIKNINDSMHHIKLLLNNENEKEDKLDWDIFRTGSYYAHVKVSKIDEFDFMFCPTRVQCRIELDTEHPCYCKVFITNKDKLPKRFTKLLKSSGEITPSKYKEFCFKIFDSIIAMKRHYERKHNEEISPAYTVQYNDTTNKIKPDFDWVPCLKVETVPKTCYEWKTRKLTDEEKSDAGIYVVAKDLFVDDKFCDLWRLSFSKHEKKIIREKCKNEDHQVIRCIKKILEEVKDDNSKLCSYHIVTHCLHCFEEIKEKPDLKKYTIKVMNLLIDRLKSRSLPHFFIPKFNLLCEVSQKECEQFIEKLNFYKNEWTK